MAQSGSITVRVDTSRAVQAIDRLIASLNDATAAARDDAYSIATMHAAFTRLSRARWPQRPLWQRVWLTYRRKGW